VALADRSTLCVGKGLYGKIATGDSIKIKEKGKELSLFLLS
jgi:hypothetical protein